MERKFSFLAEAFIFILGAFLILGAGSSALAQPKTFTMKLATTSNPIHMAFADLFVKQIEEQSQGQIKVDRARDLGTMREMTESLILGTIDGLVIFIGEHIRTVPEMDVFHIPFLLKNNDVLEKLINSELMDDINQINKKKNGLLTVAVSLNGGFRVIGTRDKVVRKPEDLKNMKMRTPPSEALQEFVRALGAVPTPVIWEELYTSLKSGMLDGVELTLNVFPMGKIDEVIKQICMVNSSYDIFFFDVNAKWFNRLPPHLQKVVYDAARDAAHASWVRSMQHVSEGFDQMKKVTKVNFTYLTEEERQAFVKAAQQRVTDRMKKVVDPKFVDRYIAAVRQAEKDSQKDWDRFFTVAK